MAGFGTGARRSRAAIAGTAAVAWFAPSYFLIGLVSGELAEESVLASALFLTVWFALSTLLLVLLRRVVQAASRPAAKSSLKR